MTKSTGVGRGGPRLPKNPRPPKQKRGPKPKRTPAALLKATEAAEKAQTEREASYLRTLEKRALENLQAKMAANTALLDDYKVLGEIPSDPLELADYAFRMLGRSMRETINDKTITAQQRRHEIRQIARSMVPLLPAQRMFAAEQVVRRAAETVQSDRRDPPVEPLPDGEELLQMDPS